MQISKDNQIELFKSLASTPLYEAGVAYNLDKFYKNKRAVKNAVYRVYNLVKNNPTEYGVSTDMVDLVVNAVSTRSSVQPMVIDNEQIDTKDMLGTIQGKTLKLLNKRLDILSKSRKKLESVSLSQLGTLAGIIFDKNQIVKGEATQNIAIHAKISKDMSPEQLIEFVQKTREGHFEENTQK